MAAAKTCCARSRCSRRLTWSYLQAVDSRPGQSLIQLHGAWSWRSTGLTADESPERNLAMLPWLWRKAPNTGGTVFYDVSHFVDGPRRTGIQRVTFEILKSWTGERPLAPGFIEPRSGRAVLLPAPVMGLTRHYSA